MGWTKRQFITQAFNQVGLSSVLYDMEPSDFESILRQLDAMMDNWDVTWGIKLSYPLPSRPELSDIDVETNVPTFSNEAIYFNLGVRVAPSFGKALSKSTETIADRSLSLLIAHFTASRPMQFPETLPRGAGNKPWRYNSNPFLQRPLDHLSRTMPWLIKNERRNTINGNN